MNLKSLKIMLMTVTVMSLCLVGAGAVFPDQDKIENETAVNMSVALSIISGRDDGTFDPEATATRAEMAKMICIILNRGNEPVLGTKPTPRFWDIKGHWGESYIEYCSALGIVSGMGDGSFHPNDKVTATQAAKMLLVALGYDASVEGFQGPSWAFRIHIVAYQKALYDRLDIDPNAPLSRDDAAQMIWNTLNATMVKYTYSVTSVNGVLQGVKIAEEYSDNRTLLQDRYNNEDYSGVMSQFSYNAAKKVWTYEIVNAASLPSSITVTSNQDYTGLYGQNVRVIYKLNGTSVDKVYGMYAQESRVLFSGVFKDLVIRSDRITFAGSSYDLDNGTAGQTMVYAFAYNKPFSMNAGTALNALSETQQTYSFAAVDNDNDGEVDFLRTYPYSVQKVSYVGEESIIAGGSYRKADCEVYDGIKNDDYTKITAAANTAKGIARLERVDKMISGTVSKVRGDDYYIDGKLYALASGVSMKIGDTVKNAVVVNDVIFHAKVSSLSMEDYALVVDAVSSSENGLFGDQAKLLLTDGSKKIVSTDQAYGDLIGHLVSFVVDRNGEYTLQSVQYAMTSGSCFDKAITAGVDKITSSGQSNRVTYIDHCLIDDNAAVFLREGSGSAENPYSYRVMSGTTLMHANKAGLSLVGAFADREDSSGFYMVKLAYITSTESPKSADRQYGYALEDYALVKNQYNETVYEYTLWNGEEEIAVLAEYGLHTSVMKGDVISYTLNEDGFIDQMSVYKTKGEHPASEVVSITGYDGSDIQFKDNATIYTIDKDKTKILYVSNEDGEALETGTIQIANQDGDGNVIANALVILDGNEISLLVIDVNNDILR